MIECPKCGAENQHAAQVCHKCSTALTSTGTSPPDLAPTIVFSDDSSSEAATGSGNSQGLACPSCGTMNEIGWSFCQQCGTRLTAAQSEPAAASGRPPGPRPVESPPARTAQPPAPQVDERKIEFGKATVPSEPPVREPVPSKPPPPPSAPKAEHPRPSGQGTVASDSGERDPETRKRAATITDASPTPASTAGVKPEAPRPGRMTVPCPKCSQPNSVGNTYCSSCGSPMGVAQTIVMSSAPAPVKARLTLIMEGGQLGDEYDLKDETVIGRTSGDISFPHDGYMSGRHARLVRRGNTYVLVDEESRNGTFMRIKKEVELKPGDMILVGKQLFRFEA